MLELPWYVFALAGAFFIALASVLEKKVLQHDEPIHFSGSSVVVASVLSLPFLFFVQWSSFTPYIFVLLYSISVLAAIAFVLIAVSLKNMDAGEQSVILAITPLVTAFFAFFVLDESLSPRALLGIVFVVCGLIVLEAQILFQKSHSRIFFKKFVPVGLALLAVVVHAASAMIDRIVLREGVISALDFIVVIQIFMLINFVAISFVRGKHDHFLDGSFMRNPLKLLLFSVLIFLSRVTYAQSASMVYIALTAVLKRTGALFTIVLGGAYLKEKHLGQKLLAGALMLLGVLFVIT